MFFDMRYWVGVFSGTTLYVWDMGEVCIYPNPWSHLVGLHYIGYVIVVGHGFHFYYVLPIFSTTQITLF